MATVELVDPFLVGVDPLPQARNGLPANGPYMRAVARALNFLLARRAIMPPDKAVLPASVRNTTTDARLWVQRYRASPNGTTLQCEVRLLPTDVSTGSPYWYLKIDGSSAADTDGTTLHYHTVRCPAGGGTSMSDVFSVRAEFTVTAGAKHTVELWTKDKCRVLGWSLREKQRNALTIGTDTVADWTRLITMSRIYDVDWQSVIAAATAIFQKMKQVPVYWSVDDPATPIAVSSTTATKLWDSAGTVAPPAPSQYRNTYIDQFAATPSIPCYAWAWAERTAGAGNVLARLKGANHTGGIDITINGALAIYESTSFDFKPQSGGDPTTAEYLVSAGGTTGNIYALGIIPLIGT